MKASGDSAVRITAAVARDLVAVLDARAAHEDVQIDLAVVAELALDECDGGEDERTKHRVVALRPRNGYEEFAAPMLIRNPDATPVKLGLTQARLKLSMDERAAFFARKL